MARGEKEERLCVDSQFYALAIYRDCLDLSMPIYNILVECDAVSGIHSREFFKNCESKNI